MYYRFLILGMVFSFSAMAQFNPSLQLDMERMNKIRKSQAPVVQNHNPTDIKELLGLVEALQPVDSNRFGLVYVLPQDNMPMLKPNVQRSNTMPGTSDVAPENGSNNKAEGKIPNAVRPKRYQFEGNRQTP